MTCIHYIPLLHIFFSFEVIYVDPFLLPVDLEGIFKLSPLIMLSWNVHHKSFALLCS